MSVIDGICLHCFERYFTLCANCGVALRRDTRRRISYEEGHVGRDCYGLAGDIVCCTCFHRDRNDDSIYMSWRPKPLDHSIATYQRIGSKRKFGVEIETSHCDKHCNLRGDTKFGSKTDCSIPGMEFDSPILYGDEGLNCIIDLLNFAANHNWRVDRDCGCHIHFDMRDESNENLYRIAYAYHKTYRMWAACVPPYRRRNSYCHRLEYNGIEIRACFQEGTSFEDFAGDNDRYDFMNTRAYYDHKTFELRLLEGTLDAVDICNWITIHTRFIDHIRTLSFDGIDFYFNGEHRHHFAELTRIINDKDLTNWMANRARRIGAAPLRGPGSTQRIRT